ncbi:trypsin-like serine peptidase [Lichenibacterium ramalinae]|uniref:Protease n=1 Tax=Lichenibacterium ramalinae TaxID=2316527 RepID=A0A4V1RIF3_9HYPH|nr:trypsin-like serine protease [Lichenibacterium ramalinae]RYB03616.1 protease [Lichenibacterium ramalinae]
MHKWGPRRAAAAALILALAPVRAEADPPPPGTGHHELVDADAYPWSAVGKLFNSIGGACTAAAIAPDRVLTAAHCLYAFRTHRFLQPDSIHFLLGYARGDYRIHARVSGFAIGPGYDPADEARTASSDWAVLMLAEPLPAALRPIALAKTVPPAGTAIEIGGFAQDRAYLMTADRHCRLLGPAAAGGVLAHDCLIAHGDSGAPLLATGADGAVEAFAVTVGFWKVDGRQVSIAAPVTAAILTTAAAAPARR